jgi:16S rRNA (guanine966-N2)-methyltransferase
MTRIIAGRFGGRRLAVPAAGTRPTSDRAREGVFSTATALLGRFDGVRVLDLYAGSGAVGLEAWSRGAARVVLVESAPRALDVLRSNIALLSVDDAQPTDAAKSAVQVMSARVEIAVARLAPSDFDFVFADPPYDLASSGLSAVIETARDRRLLATDAVIAVERASRDHWRWPDGIERVRERRYGDATIWYGRAAAISR